MTSSPQRDHGRSFARADQGRDVVAHAREGIAAALPSLVFVVAGDEVGADVADGAGNSLTRLRLLAKNVCPKVRLSAAPWGLISNAVRSGAA
jgi:hypothetical protein